MEDLGRLRARRAAALDVDALSNTRTVEYEVRTPEDADGMFDILTYQKGGSVLRMLERWLGADAFRAGVRHYLDRYQLANTETTDLWDALEQATERAGAPHHGLVDLPARVPGSWSSAATATRDDHAASLPLRRTPTRRERWAIPVLVRVARTATPRDDGRCCSTATRRRSTIAVRTRSSCSNAGGEGFYRVAYPPAWRDALARQRACSQPLERFVARRRPLGRRCSPAR